jgi:hypothetical protein
VLVCSFRRFVTHDPKGKVHGNWRQSGGGAFPIAAIVTRWFTWVLSFSCIPGSPKTLAAASFCCSNPAAATQRQNRLEGEEPLLG